MRTSSWRLAVAVALAANPALAADFYVDPGAGSPSGDGSESAPWQTLQQVVEDGHLETTISAGDTVWLLPGYHGELVLDGAAFASPVTVVATEEASALVSRVSISGTRGLVLDGLSISPVHAGTTDCSNLVYVDAASADVTIQNSDLFSVDEASGWTAAQWIDEACSAFDVRGEAVVLSGNRVRNVRFGISVSGPGALVEYNEVVNFSADGIRGLGDDGVYQYNVVKNGYVDSTLDDNHDDGFQSWSTGPDGPGTGEVRGVVLRGNLIQNREDPGQPFPATIQGIGCFDGFFVDWVVENNVVITDHWHGISFLGMRDSRIVNNTVIDLNDVTPGPPWIMVAPHKDARPSENVVVRNNLATDFDVSGTGVVDDHNDVLTDLGLYFVDPGAFDLRLLPGAPAVDTGSADLAPALDRDRIPRPQGAAVDLGAYEWHDVAVEPVDPGNEPEATGGASSAEGDLESADTEGGCGCRLARDPSGGGGDLLLVALALLYWRRRCRGRDHRPASPGGLPRAGLSSAGR